MAKNKMKRKLTRDEEFQILKLVIDKVLWIGVALMGYGIYLMAADVNESLIRGISTMIAGAVVIALFVIIMVREYEYVKL